MYDSIIDFKMYPNDPYDKALAHVAYKKTIRKSIRKEMTCANIFNKAGAQPLLQENVAMHMNFSFYTFGNKTFALNMFVSKNTFERILSRIIFSQ